MTKLAAGRRSRRPRALVWGLAAAVGVSAAAAVTAVLIERSGSGSSAVPGAWRRVPAAPFAIPQNLTSVWTGRQVVLFGKRPRYNPAVDVAEAYDPASDTWTRLSPLRSPGALYGYQSV